MLPKFTINMAFSNLAVIIQRGRRRMKRRSTVIKRRRRQRDICKSHEPVPEIPFDLVIEILTRLPAKSLMRFKSVSKLWSLLICSRTFTNLFQKVSSSPPRLYMWLDVDNRNVLLSTSSSPDDSDVSSFVIDQELTIPPNKGYYLSHVFGGLMCFVNESRAKIYNTTTRQLVVLPDIEESNMIAEDHKYKKIMYHIGHDPVHDQYKVVCIVSRPSDEYGEHSYLSEHWILLLGGDRSNRWRKIPSRCQPHVPVTQVLNISGRMHYLAWVGFLYSVLVSFDINSEEISILELPKENDFFPKMTDLIEYGRRVALLHHIDLKRQGVLNLWVVEDSKKNMWSSKTLVLHPSQMHLVNSIGLKVQGTTRNGEVVLVPQNYTYTHTGKVTCNPQDTSLFYVLLYNLQNNHMRKVEIKDTSNRYLTRDWDVIGLDDIHNLIYL
ncbi:F-box/kelch-repeat protein At4g19930 [Arabidopsis lyrata subsp. lyrata]|nr:F-box/kelch-repeat protein At4g19930 [Arabidopsis lyrata subsp. lyrata]|eukprot:XP_002869958.2 F-box/kelch-repeat protein At4g19930 [Arabidopsis lyrata subsp. lyrata]